MGKQSTTSTEGRALLTDAERAALAGERSDSYRYKTRSYLKRRIERVERDADVLAEHAPDLLDDLRAAVDAAEENDDTDGERAATPAGATDATEPTADDRDAESGRTRAESDAVDPVDHDELPDGVDVEDAREAYDAVRSHLREDGPAGMRSIVAGVMVEYSLGYDAPELDAGDRYRGAWWRNVIRPALAADPDVTHRENHGDYDL